MGPRCGVAALPVLLSLACSGVSLARSEGHFERAPSLDAVPDPDPITKYTVQEPRAPDALDHVVFKVSAGGPDGLKLLDVLTPDLDRNVTYQLRQSFDECLWKPSINEAGEPQEGSLTLLFRTTH